MNKYKFSLLAVLFFSFQTAFAQQLPKKCIDELVDASDKKDFAKELAVEVVKVKAQMMLPFGKPKDDKVTNIGMTVGCLKMFPENPAGIASLLKDVGLETTKHSATNKLKTSQRKANKYGDEEYDDDYEEEEEEAVAVNMNALQKNLHKASKPAGPPLKKCDAVFNTERRFCYDGVVYEKCDGIDYNPTTHICTDYVAYRALCNSKQYNPLTQRCGEGNVIEAKCGDGWYNIETQICSKGNIIGTKCGTRVYNAANKNMRCENNVVEIKCNAGWYNFTTQFCYNDSKIGNKCGINPQVYDPDLYECHPEIYANGIFLKTPVPYEGEVYEAILIGKKVWLAWNLNYSAEGSICYGNPDNCETYGRLYDFKTAKTACPPGWHLPSDAEWEALISYVENNGACTNCAGIKLRSSDWSASTDDYGFAALLGGFGRSDGNLAGITKFGYWWSATESGTGGANGYRMGHSDNDVSKLSFNKNSLFSVRCIKD